MINNYIWYSTFHVIDITHVIIVFVLFNNQGQKLHGELRKTVLFLTSQAMYNRFKRPSAGCVRELYYVYRKI